MGEPFCARSVSGPPVSLLHCALLLFLEPARFYFRKVHRGIRLCLLALRAESSEKSVPRQVFPLAMLPVTWEFPRCPLSSPCLPFQHTLSSPAMFCELPGSRPPQSSLTRNVALFALTLALSVCALLPMNEWSQQIAGHRLFVFPVSAIGCHLVPHVIVLEPPSSVERLLHRLLTGVPAAPVFRVFGKHLTPSM